jgi:glycogen phosphorylase
MPSRIQIPTLPGASFRLPPQLEGLRPLAYNLYWAWHPRACAIWSRIDRAAWTRHRNPIPVLSGPVDWTRLLDDTSFLAEVRAVLREFDRYMSNGADRWFARHHAGELPGPVAYFCAEYGLTEALGIYSGGLGVLAGDHMKTTSDMALPFVGVGLLYRHGYFHQTIDADGHQEHAYPDYDMRTWPVGRVQGRDGEPLTVTVALPDRDLQVAAWCVQVGRTPVILLDTDIAENDDADRPITNILYVRGREMRLHQELVLGVGGVRVLRALGIAPAVWHLNEPGSSWPPATTSRPPGTRSGATASSRSTRRSAPATSASPPTSWSAWRGRSSTATAGPAPVACRSPRCSRWAWGRTAIARSST